MFTRLRLSLQAAKGALTKRVVGPHVRALIVKTANGVFAVDPEDHGVGGILRARGSYGLDELARLEAAVQPGGRALVVGAHVGTLAIPLARACREVVAIEANPDTHRLLLWNVALNGAGNCRVLHLAAGEQSGEVELLMSRANSGGSKRVPKRRHSMYYYDAPATVKVRAERLDEALPEHGFELVVMDIEGSEYFALRGMPRILAACRVLVVEFVPHHLRNVAGVSVEDFLAPIRPHFSRLTVPSRGIVAGPGEFSSVLEGMFSRDEGDDGIVFEKA